MTNISDSKDCDTVSLTAFKETVWQSADKEHYGDTTGVDFAKNTYTKVATVAKQVVGYITYEFDLGVCEIDSLVVGDMYRKQGIGSQLLKYALEDCRSNDIHKITLITGVDWAAREFYEKHGFTVVAELNNYYRRKDFVLMDKEVG